YYFTNNGSILINLFSKWILLIGGKKRAFEVFVIKLYFKATNPLKANKAFRESMYYSIYFLTASFLCVVNVTASSISVDTGSPIKIGCRTKGSTATAQMTAGTNSPLMNATPSHFVAFSQNSTKIYGSST